MMTRTRVDYAFAKVGPRHCRLNGVERVVPDAVKKRESAAVFCGNIHHATCAANIDSHAAEYGPNWDGRQNNELGFSVVAVRCGIIGGKVAAREQRHGKNAQ